MTVRGITADLADRLNIPAGKGVVVQDVKQGSFAEDLGLNRGDVILEVNKQPVNNPDDFAKIESSLKSGQDVVFLVRPRGATGAGWHDFPGRNTSVTDIYSGETGVPAPISGTIGEAALAGFLLGVVVLRVEFLRVEFR